MKNRKFFALLLSLMLALSLLFTVNAAAAVYALGDVNGDAKITSSDARIALRCAAKLERLSEARTKAADVDRSGKVNSTDARMLLRAAAKIETIEAGENDVFEEPDVVRTLSCVTDNVDPINIFSLGDGRIALYCTVPVENEGDLPDGPDENGAFGAPLAASDEEVDPMLPEGEGDFSALDEDGRGPDEEDDPMLPEGEGDFSALDEDGRGPDEEDDWSESGDYGTDYIYIVDIENDELLETLTLPADQSLFCIRKNGQFVTMCWHPEYMTISVLNGNMETVNSFDMPNVELYEDAAHDCFYVFADSGSTLEKWSFDGEKETLFTLPFDMSFASYDADSGIAAVLQDSATYGVSTDLLFYDLNNDAILCQQPNNSYSFGFTDGLFVSSCNIPIPGDDNTYVSAIETVPLSQIGSQRLLRMPDDAYSNTFNGTHIALTTVSRYDWENDISYPSVYYLTDLENERITLPISDFDGIDYLLSCYDADTDLIAAAGASFSEEDFCLKLFAIDPSAAQFTDALETIDAPAQPEPIHSLSPGWEALRAKADALEEDFDITVIIGDPTLDYQDGSGYIFISLENPEYADEEIPPIEETDALLDMLRLGLEKYPEDFFARFRNSRGEGGLRIMLVRDLENPEGDFLAGGVAYKVGAWYNVAITVDNMSDTDTIHHELWHSAESRIEKEDFTVFSSDNWDALNPEGFEYSDDLDHYYENEELFDYIIPWDPEDADYDNVWFAEIYSTVTPYEDRATLIETLVSPYSGALEAGYTDSRDWIAQMPHLQAKLDYMAQQSERVFGCVYWDTILENSPKG